MNPHTKFRYESSYSQEYKLQQMINSVEITFILADCTTLKTCNHYSGSMERLTSMQIKAMNLTISQVEFKVNVILMKIVSKSHVLLKKLAVESDSPTCSKIISRPN
ncbi:hypothetical protein CDAR_182631 [Caerostris darwini]|uniref:Uncharacterized protein n=1 Tax=Caerostris darwini TaxID=1538125 RepID=A0AAV4SN94_9ARAC|nr:hypothetical protein CDAR_182631 [Caerostris darwini]